MLFDCSRLPPDDPRYVNRFYYVDYAGRVDCVEMLMLGNLVDPDTDIQVALQGVSSGLLSHMFEVRYTERAVAHTPIPPSDPFAQIDVRWKVSFTDTQTGNKGKFYIPCAKLDLLPVGSEILDITTQGSSGQMLVQVLENNVLTIENNSITVDSIELA